MELSEAKSLIKESYNNASWISYVQESVRNQIDYLVDNVETLGCIFSSCFKQMISYEHARRKLDKKNVPLKDPSAMFGIMMPEEMYLSAKTPVKFLMRLDDWDEPNEADVNLCFEICTKIEILITMRLINREESSIFLKEEVMSVIESAKDALNNILKKGPESA